MHGAGDFNVRLFYGEDEREFNNQRIPIPRWVAVYPFGIMTMICGCLCGWVYFVVGLVYMHSLLFAVAGLVLALIRSVATFNGLIFANVAYKTRSSAQFLTAHWLAVVSFWWLVLLCIVVLILGIVRSMQG